MSQKNLPIELLRTFVTVIEVKSYTHAADLLGRSQPAISLQMKRLEYLVGQPLVMRRGRSITLTDKGEALIGHARQILRLNDIAISQFERRTEGSTLRVGLPVDYGVRMLQSCLTGIVQRNPNIKTEIRCDLSSNIIDALRKDELDIAVGLYPGGDQQFLYRSWLHDTDLTFGCDFTNCYDVKHRQNFNRGGPKSWMQAVCHNLAGYNSTIKNRPNHCCDFLFYPFFW